MESSLQHPTSRGAAGKIRRRVNRCGERLWRFEDFSDLPHQAVAQSLSRMSRAGELKRLSKGVYYRSRKTVFGESKPNPSSLHQLLTKDHTVFPAGITAANLLGFTSQNPARRELATTAQSLPRKLLGEDAVLHTRRPEAWKSLNDECAALLDFLRNRGAFTELSPNETVERLLMLIGESNRCGQLMRVANTEPPRVRAMLGAIGEQLDCDPSVLMRLRQSLSPVSTFDFGILSALPNAHAWQAKPKVSA
ncbi:hypothetical protein COB72_00170 [bacterium]|nr:MAG: hypothetical protein COB72_00170 [bacterium]